MGLAVFVSKASTSCLAALHLLACAKNCISATPLGEGEVAQRGAYKILRVRMPPLARNGRSASSGPNPRLCTCMHVDLHTGSFLSIGTATR